MLQCPEEEKVVEKLEIRKHESFIRWPIRPKFVEVAIAPEFVESRLLEREHLTATVVTCLSDEGS